MKFSPGCNCCSTCNVCVDAVTRANNTDVSTGAPSGCTYSEYAGDWSVASNKFSVSSSNARLDWTGSVSSGDIYYTITVNGAADDELWFGIGDHKIKIRLGTVRPYILIYDISDNLLGVNYIPGFPAATNITASFYYGSGALVVSFHNGSTTTGQLKVALTPSGSTVWFGTGTVAGTVTFDTFTVGSMTGCQTPPVLSTCNIVVDGFASTGSLPVGSGDGWVVDTGSWSYNNSGGDNWIETSSDNARVDHGLTATSDEFTLTVRVKAGTSGDEFIIGFGGHYLLGTFHATDRCLSLYRSDNTFVSASFLGASTSVSTDFYIRYQAGYIRIGTSTEPDVSSADFFFEEPIGTAPTIWLGTGSIAGTVSFTTVTWTSLDNPAIDGHDCTAAPTLPTCSGGNLFYFGQHQNATSITCIYDQLAGSWSSNNWAGIGRVVETTSANAQIAVKHPSRWYEGNFQLNAIVASTTSGNAVKLYSSIEDDNYVQLTFGSSGSLKLFVAGVEVGSRDYSTANDAVFTTSWAATAYLLSLCHEEGLLVAYLQYLTTDYPVIAYATAIPAGDATFGPTVGVGTGTNTGTVIANLSSAAGQTPFYPKNTYTSTHSSCSRCVNPSNGMCSDSTWPTSITVDLGGFVSGSCACATFLNTTSFECVLVSAGYWLYEGTLCGNDLTIEINPGTASIIVSDDVGDIYVLFAYNAACVGSGAVACANDGDFGTGTCDGSAATCSITGHR